MPKINPENFIPSVTTPQDRVILTKMVKRSEEVMSEFSDLFKSKTLKKLYTPEYHYTGILPNSTYIIDKKTGEKKLIFITRESTKENNRTTSELYTGRTLGLKKLGEKMFKIIKSVYGNGIGTGVMESMANDRYSGTQIRLTQIEVERAMQIGTDHIPLIAHAEALPFHSMMGFKPDKTFKEIRTVQDVEKEIKYIKETCHKINDEFLTPIIHQKKDKFYFDSNQTIANAILRQFKFETEQGIERNFHTIYPANDVDMTLSGKELEAWKQRAISQPIFLNKNLK